MVSAGDLGLLSLAGPWTSLKLGTLDSGQDDTSLDSLKLRRQTSLHLRLKSYQLPTCAQGWLHCRALHANNFNLATGSNTPKISQPLSKLEVSRCPSSMQKWIYTPRRQKCLPSFSLLLPPPLSLFHFPITSLTGTLQCALLSSSAIYSQAISSVFPPPTWPLRAKQRGHCSQPALPPPCISHLFIAPKSRGSYFPTCSKPSDTL